MKITPLKSIGFLLLLFAISIPIALGSVSITADISNVSPAFTATPSDGGSSSSFPTNAGDTVTFTATAKDVNSNQYYLAICKTNAVTPGTNAAPMCASVPNTWAISGVTNSDSVATVTYTTQASDAESNDWYAFVCDKLTSGAACHPANGSGDQGKALGIITFSGIPVDGATLTIDGITYEFDTANNGVTGGHTRVDTSASVNGTNAATKLVLVQAGTNSTMISRANYVYVYANNAGATGNSIGMAEAGDSGNAMAESGASLTGGNDANASPFNVNHAPTFGTVTVTDPLGGTVEPGDLVKFTLAHPGQIADADTNPNQDTLGVYICTAATTSFDYGTNTCTGGATVCSDVAVNPTTTDATCTESSANLAPVSASRGSVDFKVYVKDEHNMPGTGTNAQSFTIQNSAPTQDTPALAVHAPVLANSVASWQFEDGSEVTSFKDNTSNGNNGSCSGNCPTWTQAGYSGGAYIFDGASNAISVPDSSSLRLTTAGSVAFWVKLASAPPQFGNVFDKGDWGAGHNYYSCYFEVNDLRCDTGGASSTAGSVSTTPLSQYLNTWKYVVFSWDGTKQDLYVNGSKEAENAQSQTPDTTGYGFNIGRTNYALNGTVDELNVYNRALTAAEITALYNAYTSPGISAYTTSNMDLSAQPVNVADHDSDTTTTIYNWKKNGTSIDVLNMPFDSNITSTTSGAVLDYSGNSNNGTLGGGNASYAPTWTSSGINGGAYTFDGSNDQISIPHNSSLNPTTSAALEFWIKPNSLTNADLIEKGIGSGSSEYYIRFDSGNLGFGFSNGVRDYESSRSLSTLGISAGNWYHIVFTADDSSQSGKLYVNGSLAYSVSSVSRVVSQNTLPLLIGGYSWDGYYNGSIDEVRVYNYALSAAQIAQDYNNGKPLYNTIAHQELSSADTGWAADVTINDTQTANSDSITKTTNDIDPSNSAPDQDIPLARAHAPVDANSVGYWQFEDGAGATSFSDKSGNSNTATCSGGTCPTWTQIGAIGGAYSFDGANNYISIPSSTSLNITNQITTDAWVYLTGWSNYPGIISKGYSTTGGYSVHVRSDNSIWWELDESNGARHYYNPGTALSLNSWHNVATTYDGQTLNIYIDGTAVGSGSTASFTIGTASDPVLIGKLPGYGYFQGKIDEPHIYSRALSATEIKNLYNSTSYVYKNNDLGTSAVSLSDNDNDAMACSADWRNNGTSLAVLDMPFNANVTSTASGAVTDMSTYGNNGTLGGGNAGNAPTWTNAATCGNNTGGCYQFNGSNQYIQLPNTSSLKSNYLTVETWIKLTSVPSQSWGSSIVDDATMNTVNGYILAIHSGTPVLDFEVAANSDGDVVGSTSIPTNAWTHVSGTYDGTQVKLYVNGVLDGSASDSGVIHNSSTPGPTIGKRAVFDANYFPGYIDEVKVYSRALSAAQIAADYNSGKANYQSLNNAETAIGDLWSASLMCSDTSGAVGTQLTSNTLEILGFSTDVSDGGSSASTPTPAGQNVTFTGTYNAAGTNQWYLVACKTQYVKAVNSGTPQCCSDSTLSICDTNFPTTHAYTWAVSSVTSDQAQATATYTTSNADAPTNDWYAFGCDKAASTAACSPMTQGTGDNGSPFVVLLNQAPVFTAGPSDGNSSVATPTVAGQYVTFTATAHDANGDSWYLAVCKHGYAKPGSNGAPTCCTDATLTSCPSSENWVISDQTASDSPAKVGGNDPTYTTSSGDAKSNVWFAFVCDKVSNSALCSSANQGAGDSGSPFVVNHQPVIGTVYAGASYGSNASIDPGNIAYFQVGVSDADSDTVSLYVCSTNVFTGGLCETGKTICTATGVTSGSNAQCNNSSIVPLPTPHGNTPVYVFLKDSQNLSDGGNGGSNSYSVTDVAPTVASYTVNDVSPSAGNSTPASFTVTLSDNNGGGDVASANGLIYDSNSGGGGTTLSSGLCTADQKNCYLTASCYLDPTSISGTNVTAYCGGSGTPAGNTSTITTWFNINPTSTGAAWKAHVNLADGTTSVTNSTDSNTFTVDTLSAVSVVQTSIAYVALGVGQASVNSIPTTLQNVGNIIIDVGIHGTDLCTDYPTCSTSGGLTPISQAQQHWASSTTFTYGTSDHPLVPAPESVPGNADQGCANRSIPVRATSYDATYDSQIYWKLRIPSFQPTGSYNGLTTFSSIADGQCSGTD